MHDSDPDQSLPVAGERPRVRVLVLEHDADDPPLRLADWLADAGAVVEIRRAHRGDPIPETTAGFIREWVDTGLINVIGGCCGTTPGHIHAMAKTVRGHAPRVPAKPPTRTMLAGLEPMILAA